MFEPVDRGCAGGSAGTGATGGRGGGVLYFNVTGTLQNDGTISCNGEQGNGGGGSGSGGSILIDVDNIKVNNLFFCIVNERKATSIFSYSHKIFYLFVAFAITDT